jgi:hypothetical protein
MAFVLSNQKCINGQRVFDVLVNSINANPFRDKRENVFVELCSFNVEPYELIAIVFRPFQKWSYLKMVQKGFVRAVETQSINIIKWMLCEHKDQNNLYETYIDTAT